MTFSELASDWFAITRPTVQPGTAATYKAMLNRHLLPELGEKLVTEITRADLRAYLSRKLSSMKPRSVEQQASLLYAILELAVEDELIQNNPAARIGKRVGFQRLHRQQQGDESKAFTAQQLESLLIAAKSVDPRLYPLFFTMARTGLRPGEAVALQWEDIDFEERQIHVVRSVAGRTIKTTKTGVDRFVDMSRGLCEAMRHWKVQRAEEKLRNGWPDMPPWVFLTRTRNHFAPRDLCHRFKRTLKQAKLPLHHSPHCLRHTFASIHILNGTDMVWVQRQLGHASITMTVDTYGRWFNPRNLEAADRMDSIGPFS